MVVVVLVQAVNLLKYSCLKQLGEILTGITWNSIRIQGTVMRQKILCLYIFSACLICIVTLRFTSVEGEGQIDAL